MGFGNLAEMKPKNESKSPVNDDIRYVGCGYSVISFPFDAIKEFEVELEKAMGKGWQLHGGLIVTEGRVTQALVAPGRRAS